MDWKKLKSEQKVIEKKVPISCKVIDITRSWKEGVDDEFGEVCKLEIPPDETLSKQDALEKIAQDKFNETYYDIESLAEDGFDEFVEKYDEIHKTFYTKFQRVDYWNENIQRQKVVESRFKKL